MDRYRTTCSCCFAIVTKEARELPNNNDSEGNLCLQCYGEQELDNWFRIQEMFDLVSNKLKPINKIKFIYKHPSIKYHICMQLIDKGILNWQIGK